MVLSIAAVAAFFGVNRNTITTWIANGMPRLAGRKYDLSAIAIWWRENVLPNVNQASEDSTEGLEREKLRIANERARLKLLHEAGQLVSRTAALSEIEQLFARLRARLESVPDEMGTSLPPELQAEAVADWKMKVSLLNLEIEKWSLEAK